MATTPPTELPPMPGEQGQPDTMPTELPSPTPDTDVPDPSLPAGDPGTTSPMDSGLSGDFA